MCEQLPGDLEVRVNTATAKRELDLNREMMRKQLLNLKHTQQTNYNVHVGLLVVRFP